MLRRQYVPVFSALFLLALFASACFFNGKGTQKFLVLYGNVDVRQVDLGFQVLGQVVDMPFEEGDSVPQNAYMGSLDKQPYLDRVRQAEAALLSAKYNYLNAEQIFLRREAVRMTGAISEEEYTNAKSEKDIAFARMEEAVATLAVTETDLQETEVFAPTNGTILTRIREPGTVVTVGAPIYTLSVESPVWVQAYVSEPELGLIFPGMKAEISTDTKNGKIYYGHIGFISPVAEFTPKTVQTTSLRTQLVYRIRVIAENPDRYFKQGMPVTVTFDLKQSQAAFKQDEKKRE